MGPDPAVATIRRAVRTSLADVRGAAYVACSGGADSLALAAAAAFVGLPSGASCGLVTVDHGLQDGSAEQAQRVAALGRRLGLHPVVVCRVEVGASGGPEAAARAARYEALAGLDATVLLGHTLDDQAESVLLGLGRGSGPRSIAGMRPVDGRWRRPLLGIRRAVTERACRAAGLVPWADPHNADPRFRRVRLRAEVLPLLEDVLAGGVAEALARTAEQLQHDLEALDQLTPLTDEVAALAALPRALRTRALKRWAEAVTPPLTAGHVAELERLITDWHGQGPIDLPGGYRATRRSGRLTLRPAAGSDHTDHPDRPEEAGG